MVINHHIHPSIGSTSTDLSSSTSKPTRIIQIKSQSQSLSKSKSKPKSNPSRLRSINKLINIKYYETLENKSNNKPTMIRLSPPSPNFPTPSTTKSQTEFKFANESIQRSNQHHPASLNRQISAPGPRPYKPTKPSLPIIRHKPSKLSKISSVPTPIKIPSNHIRSGSYKVNQFLLSFSIEITINFHTNAM